MDRYRQRTPSWAQLASVFAVIVLILYSWTILWFLWKLPSWLYFLNASEILIALAYSLATNLVESLVVFAVPVLLAIILPRKWFSDAFVARGATLAMAGLGFMMLLAYQFKDKSAYAESSLPAGWIFLGLAAMAFLVYLSGRLTFLRTAVEWLADRVTIFLYILMPLSVLAVLVVLFRSMIG
jgi:hypothetical protein